MLMPPPKETEIELQFADGQDPLTLDAMDVDNLVKDVWQNKVPEDSTFEAEFVRLFRQKYHRNLSRTGANMLVQYRARLIDAVKKKLFPLVEPSVTLEPEPISQNENSNS